ncbi:hypothetical protein TpMuguga_04g02490 [Theileria parva strain Muguga]|uniref:uncharacterized protein n=1 Tax=Theileria parva strain Muguga TaxID=333668 RepID=UPI001C61AF81|nr:uncharacterized protein TpMuguga_04g02490 [Theileria parva strain Muguga]KAF5153235.1 hypothetical protein TpMuguga_04g02490 [Theileria parva strain Muguga]
MCGYCKVLLPITLISTILMILLTFYSQGYITEYKRHSHNSWPTDDMTTWNALCYWLKKSHKITKHNLKSLFTTNLRSDLLLEVQNVLI